MKIPNFKSQVTLEFAFTIIIIVLLFMGAVKLFLYVNNRMVIREQFYENSADYGRNIAGGQGAINKEIQVDERKLPDLDFLNMHK